MSVHRFAPEPREPRAVCARCRRPQTVCYCAALPRLDTTTRIVILQHPRERDMPIGTARMASLCLPQAQLHVGVRWDGHPALATALADPARPPILLYPGPGAKDILAEPPVGPVTLVVVDGTWSQAKTVVRDNPVLQALPRYAFAAPELSQYRIRKEPRAEYCSTIEALMHVLGALEGQPAKFRALLDPMRAMIDAQLACQSDSPRRSTPRVAKVPRPPRRPLSADVIARRDDLVVLVGEANAWPYSSGTTNARDELVHLVLHRVATGETLARVIAPTRALSPTTTFHTGLPEERLLAGASRDAALADAAAFLRPTDLVCAWGHYGPQLVAEAGGALPVRIDLRDAAYRCFNKKIGTLEEYARSLGGDPQPVAEGRAGVRAALLAQIVRSWLA
jgi:DTW domain-containing protein YfiP